MLLPALPQEVAPPHRRPQDGAVAVVGREGAEEGGDGAVVGELLVWNVVEPGAGGLLKGCHEIGIEFIVHSVNLAPSTMYFIPLDYRMRRGVVSFPRSWLPFR